MQKHHLRSSTSRSFAFAILRRGSAATSAVHLNKASSISIGLADHDKNASDQ
jgi:hypothetical protein